ncbi:MAG: hypothetical protein GC162_18295 [Planctomycetes bacterium]|nr:hypothetical protein [Planctomycetota bacterium]
MTIEQLTADLLDDRLGSAERAALLDRLASDPEACRAYVQFVCTQSMIARVLRRQPTTHNLPLPLPPLETPAPTAPRRRPAAATALALAALIALAATLIYFFLPFTPHSPLPTPHSDAPASFAMLSDVSPDAQFSDAEYALGSDLSGPIQLTAGRAQLMFKSTAVVDLTGPCEFEMTGPNRGRLTSGKLEAFCRPEAHGFTVDLPNRVRVVDLGTRFNVEIDRRGDAEVHVIEGRVQVSHNPAHAIVEPYDLSAGQFARFIDGRLVIDNRDLAEAPPAQVISIDFGQASPYEGPGVAAHDARYWNHMPTRTANHLITADGQTATNITITTTAAVLEGRLPGQSIALFNDYAFNHERQGPWSIRLDDLDDTRSYDLVIYTATANHQGSTFTIAGESRRADGERTDSFIESVNYVRFVGIHPAAGRIEITVSAPDDHAYMCNGLQLIADSPFAQPQTQDTPTSDGTIDHPRLDKAPTAVPPELKIDPKN